MCCSIDENDISAVFDFVSDTPSTILETDIFEIMIDRCSEAKPRLPSDTPRKSMFRCNPAATGVAMPARYAKVAQPSACTSSYHGQC